MSVRFLHLLLLILITLQAVPAQAREGDTLKPIEIDAPALETYPDDLLAQGDFEAIESRVYEARTSGVPLAVRIVDMTQEAPDLPVQIRQYARDDFGQPMSPERQQAMVDSWGENEVIETSEDADDGFLLLVLVPEDRTQTLAMWWMGDNALPINGLTEKNILATQDVMNEQFAAGNMPNGVYLGISEFSYNVQFGVPARLQRTEIGSALHTAVVPLAIGTTLAGLLVPALAWWLARKNTQTDDIDHVLTPWQAAAVKMKRTTPTITTAMLLEAVHKHEITPGKDGSVRLENGSGNAAVNALRPFANADGIVSPATMYEVEAITAPIRTGIENDLAAIGLFTQRVRVDRTWMLLAMGIALLIAALAVVPTVVSKSALGAGSIAIAVGGVVIGWWWLRHRSYTTPAGDALLAQWLESAAAEDRHLFDTAVHLHLLTDQVGGPNVNRQTHLVRLLRGLSAG